MKYFEDIQIGDKITLDRHTFTADEIKAFAQRFDPQPFHLDEKAAARSHFGALCASGWHTAAVWMRMLVDAKRRASVAMDARGVFIRAARSFRLRSSSRSFETDMKYTEFL